MEQGIENQSNAVDAEPELPGIPAMDEGAEDVYAELLRTPTELETISLRIRKASWAVGICDMGITHAELCRRISNRTASSPIVVSVPGTNLSVIEYEKACPATVRRALAGKPIRYRHLMAIASALDTNAEYLRGVSTISQPQRLSEPPVSIGQHEPVTRAGLFARLWAAIEEWFYERESR